MDKVSIIVPVYNVAPFLCRCIDSLLSQTYSNLEILLIDDFSKDGCREIIEKYAKKDNRIHPLYQVTNQGVSAARNRALDVMTGDWVCFCDGDDWYDSDFIEKMLNCGKQEKADYIICNYKIVSGQHPTIVSGSIEGLTGGCDPRLVIACGPTASCTHLIQRSLFEISGLRYPEKCRQYEELPVIPVLAKYAKKIGIVKEPLYNYFQRGDGTSASNTAFESEKNFFIAWNIMKKNLGKEYSAESEYHAIYSLFYGEVLNLCKRKAKKTQIIEKIEFYEKSFPSYYKNPYLQQMGRAKRIFLWMGRKRMIFGIRLLSWIHGKIVN